MTGTAAGKVLIIAEAGVNHNGDVERAKIMVREAAKAGADFVKFQSFRTADLVSASASTAAYQRANAGAASQADLLSNLELGPGEFASLAGCCRSEGIGFLCTPFDPGQLDALLALGMSHIKIASGELTNRPALQTFAKHSRPILLSTGMASLDEVRQALATLRQSGATDVTLLHCTSLYPAPMETVNLRAMVTLRETFGCPVGYSDHSLGDHVAVAAVALGASVIEKHFTLDRGLPGPDHAASLEPDEFAVMVRRLRETARALGDGIKRPAPGEPETAALVRRSWHAARDLGVGTVLTESDLALKRPANGLAPDSPPVGRRLSRAVAKDRPITSGDLQ
jgi:N-acetylneuraminate synthase/N,N'-diacetyllegionaminate synthase